MMSKTELRQVALSATRSEARRKGIVPEQITGQDALFILDDLHRASPELVASQWYEIATENQITLFIKEWEQWRKMDVYPVSHALALLEMRDCLDKVITKALLLPEMPESSFEQQQIGERITALLSALERKLPHYKS